MDNFLEKEDDPVVKFNDVFYKNHPKNLRRINYTCAINEPVKG